MTGPRAAYSERTGRVELGLCLSRVCAQCVELWQKSNENREIGNLRDGRDSPEGEHRGLGSRGVDGKAARVAGLERERKNQ